MVTITPGNAETPPIALESAGRLGEHGPDVMCSVVMAEGGSEAFGIIPGCGALAVHYYEEQLKLAEFGISSVVADPLYEVVDDHANQFQSMAAERVFLYFMDEYQTPVRNLHTHSWGAAKAASLLHHGFEGVDMAVFHNPSGKELPYLTMMFNPAHTIRGLLAERRHTRHHRHEQQVHGVPDLGFPSLRPDQWPALVQHMLVAASHRKLEHHLRTINPDTNANTFLVGLWSDTDMLFSSQHSDAMHYNEVLPDSVHTEPQSNPERVVRKLAGLLRLRDAHLAKARVLQAREAELPTAIAGL